MPHAHSHFLSSPGKAAFVGGKRQRAEHVSGASLPMRVSLLSSSNSGKPVCWWSLHLRTAVTSAPIVTSHQPSPHPVTSTHVPSSTTYMPSPPGLAKRQLCGSTRGRASLGPAPVLRAGGGHGGAAAVASLSIQQVSVWS